MSGERSEPALTRGLERSWDDPEQMLGVDEARERVLAEFSPLPVIEIPLLDSLGLAVARDIVSEVAIPPFRNSAMDGYAVSSADVSQAHGEGPVRLRVVAQAPAGSAVFQKIGPGEAVRIMTGAPMPVGADAVVRFEETDEYGRETPFGVDDPTHVRVFTKVRPGANVREAGEDVAPGSVVLARGRMIGPAEIGLLAALNRATVPVHRRPRIGILSTGDEVIGLGPDLGPGQIRDSNSYTLAALARQHGAEPLLLGVARDSFDDIRARLRARPDVDLILTSGGVSVGDFDLVKRVLQSDGSIELWQVRIKPGKPMAFGRIGETSLLGLPGNPVAAIVAFLQFVRPAIAVMLGLPAGRVSRLRARLVQDHENRGRRRHFVRGFVEQRGDELVVQPVGASGSAILSSVSQANCFIVLPEQWDQAKAGSVVDVELLVGASIGGSQPSTQ